jgi:hypothetical protein
MSTFIYQYKEKCSQLCILAFLLSFVMYLLDSLSTMTGILT